MEARPLGVYFYEILTFESCKYFTHLKKKVIPKIENILKGKILTVYQNLT